MPLFAPGCSLEDEREGVSLCPSLTELTRMKEEIHYLRAAINDMQLVCGIPSLPVTDYKSACEAIRNVIRWNVAVALDPAVSEDARKLQAQARTKALREAVEIIRSRVQVRIEPHFRAAASKIEAGIAGGMAAMADDVAAAVHDLIMHSVPVDRALIEKEKAMPQNLPSPEEFT